VFYSHLLRNSTAFAPCTIITLTQLVIPVVTRAEMAAWGQSSSTWNDAEANKLPEKVEELERNGELPKDTKRKRVVVVGLGMVGISFM